MPDLRNHTIITTGASVQVGASASNKALQYTCAGTVVDSTTGANLASYSFVFPGILTSLNATQTATLMQLIYRYIIQCEAGL